jgi:hypothetical protein
MGVASIRCPRAVNGLNFRLATYQFLIVTTDRYPKMDVDPARAEALIAPYRTVSDRIRALARAGYSRADIARILNKRYQHVRNVLEADAQKQPDAPSSPAGHREVAEAPTVYETAPTGIFRLVVDSTGTALLPADLLKAIDAAPSEPVMVELIPDGLVVRNWRVSARRAQAFVRSIVPPGVSLVEELIAERREEARREAEDG